MTVSAMNMVSYCHGKAQGDELTTWPVGMGMTEPEDNRLFASKQPLAQTRAQRRNGAPPASSSSNAPAKILETLLQSPYHLRTRQSGSPLPTSLETCMHEWNDMASARIIISTRQSLEGRQCTNLVIVDIEFFN